MPNIGSNIIYATVNQGNGAPDNKLPTTLSPISSLHLLRAGTYFYGETPSEVLQYPPTINCMGFRFTVKVGFSFTCESCKISDKLCNSNPTK